ncbi:MAG TPA: LecA/PA-IL family lectin [Vicinamibacterales bacterium]|nr:LecA/PA-IL family lectin [Vicinamibacterales bacterium]
MYPQRWFTGVAVMLALTAGLQADTLYLRDGSRVQGELIGFRNGTIEFEERRGFGGGRTLRFDRDEVVRIEFENNRRGSGNDFLSGGRPSGMRERQVIVSADVPWNDAGIDVRAGQTIYFESQGQVRWGRDRRDGPAGERNSPSNPNRPMGNRNAAALIGKVGNASTDYFFIGDETGPIRMRSAGRLYLGINDDVLTDNSGNFRVVVYY